MRNGDFDRMRARSPACSSQPQIVEGGYSSPRWVMARRVGRIARLFSRGPEYTPLPSAPAAETEAPRESATPRAIPLGERRPHLAGILVFYETAHQAALDKVRPRLRIDDALPLPVQEDALRATLLGWLEKGPASGNPN